MLPPGRVALYISLARQQDRQHDPQGDQDAPPESLKQDDAQDARQTKVEENAPAPPSFGHEKKL
jgi:hypothetical protein